MKGNGEMRMPYSLGYDERRTLVAGDSSLVIGRWSIHVQTRADLPPKIVHERQPRDRKPFFKHFTNEDHAYINGQTIAKEPDSYGERL